MALTIQFTPREEAWINTRAVEHGQQPEEIVKQLVDAQLPDTFPEPETVAGLDAKTLAAIAMLDAWIEEGMKATPEEVRLADLEVEEFKQNMNANRADTGERILFP